MLKMCLIYFHCLDIINSNELFLTVDLYLYFVEYHVLLLLVDMIFCFKFNMLDVNIKMYLFFFSKFLPTTAIYLFVSDSRFGH